MGIETKVYYDVTSPTYLRFAVKCGRGRNVRQPGDVAGVVGMHGNGYSMVGRLLVHRVVWFLHKGYWPDTIDHINGVRTDNRIENLRDVSQAQNSTNVNAARGFSWSGSRKRFCVVVKGRNYGRYSTILDARAAYLRAAREVFPLKNIGGGLSAN